MATGTWGPLAPDYRVFRAKIQWTALGQRCQTGFHLRDMGVAGQTPLDVATAVAALANSAGFRQLLHVGDQITSVDVVNLVTAEGHTIAPSSLMGLSTGERAPTFIQVPAKLVGGLRKRYANGRMLLPLGSELHFQGNDVVGAGVTALDAFVTEMTTRFMDDSITGELRLVHLHEAKPERPKATGGTLPAVPASWYDVTAIVASRAVSALRSRKAGVGS